MALIHGNEQEFNNEIKEGLVIVDFFATWCGPCRMLGPVLEQISSDYKVVKIDVDECPNISREYGVMSVPTVIKFMDGKEVKKNIGFLPKDELIKWIEE